MGFSESTNFTGAWARQLKDIKKYDPRGSMFGPLEVQDREKLKAIRKNLEYILSLDAIQKVLNNADTITLILKKGEESKKPPLSTTPIVSIKPIRDEERRITETDIRFQRGDKYCTFIIPETPNTDMRIGDNNLSGYNNAVEGWVDTGVNLIKKTIKDNYIPTTQVEITYSDTPTPNTSTPPTVEDIKGPMEI